MTTLSEELSADGYHNLPWRVAGDDGIFSSTDFPVETAITHDGGISYEIRPLVVRAVNAHDALVAAMEEALPYVCRYEGEHMSNIALAVIQKADAALALARGGK